MVGFIVGLCVGIIGSWLKWPLLVTLAVTALATLAFLIGFTAVGL